ncbi:MAG: DUF1501 domain-containing protein [Pirellulales bacterium]|nr:DUF1501 domain-containing protein [Pirellulales bacterium]
MNFSRREVLQVVGGAASAAVVNSGGVLMRDALAAPRKPQASPALVAVFLRGGLDALSTLVPYADNDYARYRPAIALAAPDAGDKAVLHLDSTFGFNPNMRALHELYNQGMCIPIINVGSPHPTRSHFDAQDFMERGAPGMRQVATGWLNRYLQTTRSSNDPNLRAVSMQPLLPRALRGDYPVLAKPQQKADHALALYSQLYSAEMADRPARQSNQGMGLGTKQAVEEFGARTIEQLWELTRILEQPSPVPVEYPRGQFGDQMRDVAKLIKSQCGLEIAAVDYGGWDHHINVGPLDGQLGKRLSDVSGTLGAFVADLGPAMMRKTTILVMSEFGRTVRENNNQGTDHGHGGLMLVVGGSLNGRKTYGEWLGLEESKLYQRRDLPVLTDFRIVFAELLKGVFGYDGLSRKMFESYEPKQELLGFMA